MSEKLRKDVQVAGDDDPVGSPLRTLEAGTLKSSIPESELAQLSDGHFEGSKRQAAEEPTEESAEGPEE